MVSAAERVIMFDLNHSDVTGRDVHAVHDTTARVHVGYGKELEPSRSPACIMFFDQKTGPVHYRPTIGAGLKPVPTIQKTVTRSIIRTQTVGSPQAEDPCEAA